MNVSRWMVCVALVATPVLAEGPLDPEAMAQRLLASTVSVRISSNPSPADETAALPQVAAADASAGETIYLASGVSLGRGLIVTFCRAPTSARFRATLHNGQQAEAELRVADDYSGLRLIEVPNQELPRLELATEAPKPGAAVMTAAAMGLENPLVSLGVVSGVDYLPAGVELPPLVVCDVRSVETSSGGPVINRDGKLVGVVAATSNAMQKPGWTYAIPGRHVQRLVAAKADNQVVLLRRQRPVAGFTLGAGPGDGVVRVERVESGGPADRAGIKPGDLLLEAEGRKIRSAYQAIDLILRKQPGDRVPLVVQHSGGDKEITMTLAGTPVASQSYDFDSNLQVGPQSVNVTMVPPNKIEVFRNVAPATDPTANLLGAANRGVTAKVPRVAQDEMATLKNQLAAFEQSVARLQDELRRRDQTQAETNKLIESMTSEIARLRKQLEDK